MKNPKNNRTGWLIRGALHPFFFFRIINMIINYQFESSISYVCSLMIGYAIVEPIRFVVMYVTGEDYVSFIGIAICIGYGLWG